MRCACCGQDIPDNERLAKTDKEIFFEFWLDTLGQADCEQAWVDKEAQKRRDAPTVISDVSPFQSMVDGTMITSRSQYREHLKRHGKVEVGNDYQMSKPTPPKPDPKLKEFIAHQVYEKLRYK
jgi:hypothetical protein